jgi:ABC-2 type transport system ATP-binding protein
MSGDAPFTQDSLVNVPVRTRRGVIAEAVRLLTAQGIGVDDINLRRPTLDDVFLSLTGHAAEEPGEPSDDAEDERA